MTATPLSSWRAIGRAEVRPADRVPAQRAPGRQTRVALISEGTYPHHFGGVSVWIDQLIRGMPEHRFDVVALSVTGEEKNLWEIPPNLNSVINIPLWTDKPRRKAWEPDWFADAHSRFLRALIRPAEVRDRWSQQGRAAFLSSLRAMFLYAQSSGDLSSALVSNAALTRLMDTWHAAGMDIGEPLCLADALTAASLIEHMLRPLSAPPVDVDICHLAMNGLAGLVALASKWAYGSRIVLSEHGVYLRERYLAMVNEPVPHAVKVLLLNFFRTLAVATYHSADLLAPHSNYNRRWALYNGAKPARMRTMYNGVDPADFPPAEGEPDVPTIVFMGRIDPLKDLHTLIRAFAIVKQHVPDARLRMFGPVPEVNQEYAASCQRLVDELGLTGAATFEGRIPNQADAYHAGHINVLTSISEGFPYTLMEAMATGRPPVCTNVGGVAEAVGDAGIVCAARDHEAIAAGCVRLLTNHALRRRLGRMARERILNNFTLQQSIEAYRSVYREVLP
ncbi:GT4 family glycosyltransferase PelF [Longispora albida]|uniref:GT4 family glycosyltransferase PelF n=1 Tax=Longispora albida TaxID=203523 RepID=UPI00035E5EB7|nr:GT4 family glycosyltransferase PelF [Longispora albida]